MMVINVCRGILDYSPQVSALTRELGYGANECQTKDWLGYLINSNAHAVFVALNNDQTVCGWVVVEKRMSLETGFKAEITGLIVGEKYRHCGVGQALVSAALGWAKELHLAKMVVRSNVQRQESHGFYKHFGFDLTKTAHHYELSIS